MRRSLGISEPAASRLEITRMRRRHLRGVMAIERQVYARPWSPNLFVAEMTEPNNRCYLVARIDKVVVGYAGMICYGDEAHITNIAVDPQRHRHGIGARLLYEQMLPGDRDGRARGLAGGPRHELGRAAPLRPLRLSPRGHPPQLLPGAQRGRAHHVDRRRPHRPLRARAWTRSASLGVVPGRRGPPRDHPRHRDLLRRDRRRGGGGRVHACAPTSSRPRSHLHERFGGVVPEVAARAHVEALNPLLEEALAEAGVGFGDLDHVAVTVGPGPGRRAAHRDGGRRRPSRSPPGAGPDRREPPGGPRLGELPGARAARPALRRAGGERRPHDARAHPADVPSRGAGPDARRRGGRGVRQGGAPDRPGVPGRARARPHGARGRPERDPRSRARWRTPATTTSR